MPDDQVRCGLGTGYILAMILDGAIRDGLLTSEQAVELLRSIPSPPLSSEQGNA